MTTNSDHRSTWLLVGASGRVGRLLLAHWRRRPPPARLARQYRRGGDGLDTLVWLPLDGPAALEDWARRNGEIDAMLVFAGATPGSADLVDNRRLAEACMGAALRLGISTCLVASSAAVYGAGNGIPFREDGVPEPVSAYGHAKCEMERACLLHRDRGLGVSVLRIGNVAGADALLGQVTEAGATRTIMLDRFDDGGGPVRSYIDPATLARVLETLASRDGELPFRLNIAAPSPVPMAALLDAARLPWAWRPAPPEAVQHVTLDCTRLSALYPFGADASDPAAIVGAWRLLAGV